MSKKRKPIPVFKGEAEERAFWESHDSADYVAGARPSASAFPVSKKNNPR